MKLTCALILACVLPLIPTNTSKQITSDLCPSKIDIVEYHIGKIDYIFLECRDICEKIISKNCSE